MASVVTQPVEAEKPQNRKGPRRNYNQLHRNLLPVEIYPLPVLIPHNPLSLIAIALSYLAQYLSPPQRTMYKGYFSSGTSSVHITDPATIRVLWEMGFFGRGSLSRSEPTWLESQKSIGVTAAEVTGQRRNERRQQKLERAKKEQEEMAKKLSEESGVVSSTPDNDILKTNATDLSGIESVLESAASTPDGKINAQSFEEWRQVLESNGLPTPPATSNSSEADLAETRPIRRLQRTKTVRFSPTIEAREFDLSSPVISPIKNPGISTPEEKLEEPVPIENKEHLNLSLDEAFFLSYGLGVLDVYCENTDTCLPPTSLLSLFRRHSYPSTRSLSIAAEPDDPFMLSYTVYHHYRSLGWVVRSGVKFSVDFLLYNRGPAFSHAEFAVIVLPSYSHGYWNETAQQRKYVTQRTEKTWWWLHGVNRVQAQVHKQLLLCYVDIPPPLNKEEKGFDIDIGRELSRYRVKEVGIRRWTPNRSRD